MPKISINLLGWNHDFQAIKKSIDSFLAQDFEDFEFVFSDNGSANGLLDFVRETYKNEPKVRVVDNGENLGFAGGHNKFFSKTDSEFLMTSNPDVIADRSFLKNMLKAFDDPDVGAATGKMLKLEKAADGKNILDGTGIEIYKSRRARERGQWQEDIGQYDNAKRVFGVSGTAALYRKSALQSIKLFEHEFIDEDFFAYWEDLDLSWRLRLAGWECAYVPEAIVFHPRAVGSSRGGYKKFAAFKKHHQQISEKVRKWNWRNHLFAIIKNDFGWNFWKGLPFILARETAMLGYIIFFEPSTLKAVPDFFRLLPKMLIKRKIIQSKRKVTSQKMERWFN